MTALRTRFIEDMQLHGYSPKTQACYVGAVCGLAKHYHKSPDLISEEELRRYFLFLTLEKQVARATATIALCGIKFFFQNTLQRNWTCFKLLRPAKGNKPRLVPLAQKTLEPLRQLWPSHRSPLWLFPAVTRHGFKHSVAHNAAPIHHSTLQRAFRRVLRQSGVRKQAHVHSLRHSMD